MQRGSRYGTWLSTASAANENSILSASKQQPIAQGEVDDSERTSQNEQRGSSGKLIEAKSNHPMHPIDHGTKTSKIHTHSRTSWAKGLRAFVDYVVLVSYLDGCQRFDILIQIAKTFCDFIVESVDQVF